MMGGSNIRDGYQLSFKTELGVLLLIVVATKCYPSIMARLFN